MITQPFSDIAKDATQQGVYALLLRILNMLKAPVSFDRALNRLRVTAAIESGTVTTVTTVTTVSTLTNLSQIDSQQARILPLAANRQSWALNVRARIS